MSAATSPVGVASRSRTAGNPVCAGAIANAPSAGLGHKKRAKAESLQRPSGSVEHRDSDQLSQARGREVEKLRRRLLTERVTRRQAEALGDKRPGRSGERP